MAYIDVNIKVDAELKEKADWILELCGMDIESAVNVFLFQAIRDQKIPFKTDPPAKNNK